MKVLVTGFDPFGGDKVNPAYEAVKKMPDEISGAEILSGQTALQNTTLIPKPNTPEASEELFVIPPHTLYEKYPPKIPEEEIKTVEETGEIVLSRVVIPAGVRTTCNILMVPNTSYHRS